jgi:UDP-N-acetylglucosamine:LPS N-acetylglucosamine transferase
MGHVTRDVAIAREIHRQMPDVDLVWVASPLATKVLGEAGEQLLPESSRSADYNSVHDKTVAGYGLDLLKYVRYGRKLWEHNVQLFKEIIGKYDFDLVVGDEVYELIIAVVENRLNCQAPIVMIHDFLGVVPMGWNPIERLVVYILNRKAVQSLEHPSLTHFFVGEPEDVPDRRAGTCLPFWRELTNKHVKFLGYIIRFQPDDYADKAAVRARLGYGPEPLVVCALGGGSVGKGLLELCGQAYPIMRKQIPNLRMVVAGGGLFSPESVRLPAEVAVKGYVPDLHEHFAASDLVIVVGGGTSTIELTALRRPFIYFPLERQFEQQIYVPRRLERYRAGTRLAFNETTPDQLAAIALQNMNGAVDYVAIPVDGARKAARLLGEMLAASP